MNRYRGDEMNCYMQSELQAQFPVKEKIYEAETPLGTAEQLAALEGIKNFPICLFRGVKYGREGSC